jgi:hypothetical protein
VFYANENFVIARTAAVSAETPGTALISRRTRSASRRTTQRRDSRASGRFWAIAPPLNRREKSSNGREQP